MPMSARKQYFYMTYARSRPNEIVPWMEANDVPVLTNAVHRWSDRTERLLDMWEYDTRHVIDAGGYNVMSDYVTRGGELAVDESILGEQLDSDTPFYPWSLSEYDAWLSAHSDEFEWATVMDYACEQRFDSLWGASERRTATLDNTIRQFNRDPDYTLLPVLQGRCVNEWVNFYDQLCDYGIPTDHVGLGTVCRLSSQERIADVEKAIRAQTGIDRLHGFGVKIDAFRHGATFDSADSQAWVYEASNGKVVIDEGDRMRRLELDDPMTRTFESFKNYYSYVTRVQTGQSRVDYDPPVTPTMSDSEAREALVAT